MPLIANSCLTANITNKFNFQTNINNILYVCVREKREYGSTQYAKSHLKILSEVKDQ